MKTKAFSKEGLARDAQMTPEERKRQKTRDWVQDVVGKLKDQVRWAAAAARRAPPRREPSPRLPLTCVQIDEMEAEMEAISEAAAGGPKKKEREALAAVEAVVSTHRFHGALRVRGGQQLQWHQRPAPPPTCSGQA